MDFENIFYFILTQVTQVTASLIKEVFFGKKYKICWLCHWLESFTMSKMDCHLQYTYLVPG